MESGNSTTRRNFLKQTTSATVGFAFIPAFAKVPPSDRLQIAHIGLGGMGNAHVKWFANIPEVDIVALCDVDADRLKSTAMVLKDLLNNGIADEYADFRNILDRQDIDAITCATPDHWHATIATMAFQAGKDVYGEKPLSYNVREGQVMLKNLKKYNRIFQLGTQIHAGDNYHRVVEIIRSGVIGKVHTVRLWKSGNPPIFPDIPSQPPPASLNWDMWLGPAPFVEYTPARCHRTFRHFLDYSGGVYADFWCHIADVVWWAISPEGLETVEAKGEAPPEGIGDAPYWIDVDFKFKDLMLHWTTKPPEVQGAMDRSIGAYFEGEQGTLICDYESHEITINGEKVTDIPEVPKSLIRSPGHQQNFIDAVKSRSQPESNLEYVRKMTLPMHLGLISYRLGRKLTWNEQKERFKGDHEANELLSRKARKPWDLI